VEFSALDCAERRYRLLAQGCPTKLRSVLFFVFSFKSYGKFGRSGYPRCQPVRQDQGLNHVLQIGRSRIGRSIVQAVHIFLGELRFTSSLKEGTLIQPEHHPFWQSIFHSQREESIHAKQSKQR
jgi:hypothetical protein